MKTRPVRMCLVMFPYDYFISTSHLSVGGRGEMEGRAGGKEGWKRDGGLERKGGKEGRKKVDRR